MKKDHILQQPFCCQRDGLRLYGRVFRQEAVHQKIALCLHGFMATQHSQMTYAKKLAQLGYAAFVFDFAGGSPFSKSDGRFSNMTLFGEVEDCLAVLRFARLQPYTHKGPALLLGCSQGGVVAALAAARCPEWVDQLALLYPAFVAADDARSGRNLFFEFDPQHIPDQIPAKFMPWLKLSGQYPKELLEEDLYMRIVPYSGSVLILQGTSDAIVPFCYARNAFETYQRSGARVRLVPLQGAGHGFSPDENKEVFRQIQHFLIQSPTPCTAAAHVSGR